MNEKAYLSGKNVYLRPLEPEDAAELKRFLTDPAVARTLQVWRPLTLERERDFITRTNASETDIVLGIARHSDDRLLGVTGLHGIEWRDRHAQFGIFIGEPAEWGKGYGTEATELVSKLAFERLDLQRLWLLVYDMNERGVRAYERAGYVREGVLREHVYRDGARHDAILMGLLAREWRLRSVKTPN